MEKSIPQKSGNQKHTKPKEKTMKQKNQRRPVTNNNRKQSTFQYSKFRKPGFKSIGMWILMVLPYGNAKC